MIAKYLRLHNFYSHTDTELSFNKELYTILGKKEGSDKSNGSGKTSICRGISYALYGDSADSEKNTRSLQVKGDGLIYNNAAEMEVVFGFELNGDDYIIRRVLKRGATATIYIAKNGEKQIKYGIKDGQAIINNILGTTYEIFKNTCYFQQGELSAFSKLTPKAAKDLVLSILQLDIYNVYETQAKESSSLIKAQIQQLQNELNTTQALIAREMESQKEQVSKYTKQDLLKVEQEITDLKFAKQLQAFWEQSKNNNIEALDKRRQVIYPDLSKIDAEINLINQRITKMYKLGQNKTCPTCEQELKPENITSITNLLKSSLESKLPQKQQLQEAIKLLDTSKSEIKSYALSLYKEDDLLDKMRKITEIKTELKKTKSDASKITELKEKAKKLNLEIEVKQNLFERYKKVQEAFGRNGIPAYIIENVIPEIEETTNDILKGLESNISISIESQKELKTGGFAETLDINVDTAYGLRPYANYSGGEKTFIDFALRMALSIILARRANCQIQTLILDEFFGELDAVNRQIVAKAIKFVATRFDFKRIFLISHCEELQDFCKNIIYVKFDGKKSYI